MHNLIDLFQMAKKSLIEKLFEEGHERCMFDERAMTNWIAGLFV
jgi:hypothetical protein